MSEAIVIHEPDTGAPEQLFLLFHGVGSTAENLAPLGEFIAAAFPQAAIVSVPGAFESDLGMGRQWFSVRGVTEENRPARIAEAMPLFVRAVRDLQQRFGIGPQATTLVGFSQGAIMSLESARAGEALAARIVSIAGRFAELPDQAPQATIHFVHGRNDVVVPAAYSSAAAEKLKALGATVTQDLDPSAGHEITQRMAEAMLARLRG